MANSELDDFLGGLDNEPKDDPLASETQDIFPTEEKKEVTTEVEKEERPLPFHKDPKVLRFIEKEIEKRQPKQSETERFVQDTATSKEEEDEILESLTEIVGNDTPQKVSAVNRLRKALAGSEERAVTRALSEIQTISIKEQEAERQADEQAENELADGFDRVEQQFNVDLSSDTAQATKDRNGFIDFIERIAPKDAQGEVTEFPDFEEAYRLYSQTKKGPSNSRAKELASRGMDRSSDASTTKPTGGNSWKDVDKIFSKMKD